METLYYVILYRPKSCQCWTPVANCWCGPAGNFFASPIRATEAANNMAGQSSPVWLAGEKRWTALEFKVAQVVIDRNVPDFVSPEPSPNRLPPDGLPPNHPRSGPRIPPEPPGGADADF